LQNLVHLNGLEGSERKGGNQKIILGRWSERTEYSFLEKSTFSIFDAITVFGGWVLQKNVGDDEFKRVVEWCKARGLKGDA